MSLPEIVIAVGAFGTIGLYHVTLWLAIRNKPDSTTIGRARNSRHRWLQFVMTEQRDLLAVQTLRNWIMAASFLASTAVLLTIGSLGFLLNINEVPIVLSELNFLGSTSTTTFTFKCLLLALLFSTAFFSFSLSIRNFNHMALDICVPLRANDEETVANLTSLFNRSIARYTLGMRSYYLAIPVTLWFFGPLWMAASSIILLIVLYRSDSARVRLRSEARDRLSLG